MEPSPKKIKIEDNEGDHDCTKHPGVQALVELYNASLETTKNTIILESETAAKNVELEAEAEVARRDMDMYREEIQNLQKELERNKLMRQMLLDENLKLMKENYELHNTPSTVSPPPRKDERAIPAIEQSPPVKGISNLLTELLIYNTMIKKNANQADLTTAIHWVSSAIQKLLLGTEEQVSRALYILARSLYSKKYVKNMFVGSYNKINLEKILQPSEYALVCGLESSLTEKPELSAILKRFCMKLEYELLQDGQLSHCRVYAVVCRHLNEPYMPFRICKELLLKKKEKGMIFIAMIGCIFPDALKLNFESNEHSDIETKVFYNFILSKPEHMMQVEQCHNIFCNECELPASPPYNFQAIVEEVLQNLVNDFLQESPNSMPNLLSVRLLKLQMGCPWLLCNVLDPFLSRVGNRRSTHNLKKFSEILRVCSEPEN